MFGLLRSVKKAMGFTKYTHQVLEHIQTIYGDDVFIAVSTYLKGNQKYSPRLKSH